MNKISQLGYEHGREALNYQNYWQGSEDRKLYDWGYKIGFIEWAREQKNGNKEGGAVEQPKI